MVVRLSSGTKDGQVRRGGRGEETGRKSRSGAASESTCLVFEVERGEGVRRAQSGQFSCIDDCTAFSRRLVEQERRRGQAFDPGTRFRDRNDLAGSHRDLWAGNLEISVA